MSENPKKTNTKPTYELQDILNLYGDTYTSNHTLTFTQQKAMKDISTCRTSKQGYNARECSDCKNIEFSYNSCRNRNCPKCQQQKRFEWIEKRVQTTIDVPYYHTVFTVPNQLFDIAIYNQKIFYDLLFKCASDTLKQFAQELKWWKVDGSKYADDTPKVDLSFFGILHTWGETLVYHPHIHFIVAGAAIMGDTIIEPKYNSKFLFPVKAMSKVFRGKFIEGIKKRYYEGKLIIDKSFKDSNFFENYIDNIVNRKWVIYMKSQFKGSTKIVEYMARYTHKSAIANSRIVSIDNNTIRFRYKDYKANAKTKIMTLSSDEFIKRFLYHIPPKRYFRIRYYGVIQKLSKIKNSKIIKNTTIQDKPTKASKPPCKKCQCTKIETVVVVDVNKIVIQGFMTPDILKLKKEIGFNDST